MKIIDGNILDMNNGYICHLVNCKGALYGGMKKEMRERFPKVYKEYKEKVANRKGSLLGEIQLVEEEEGRIFVNMFSQDDCGCVGSFTNYEAVEKCFLKLKKEISDDKVVYFPYGFGSESINWDIIVKLIEKYFKESIVVKK